MPEQMLLRGVLTDAAVKKRWKEIGGRVGDLPHKKEQNGRLRESTL
jgi:hypothetical protein